MDIIAAYAAFKLSDPIPNIHLPANIVPYEYAYPPITTILYPNIKIDENMKMLTLTPILSINIPPKNGNIILGAEYIEYNILNYTLFNPISA